MAGAPRDLSPTEVARLVDVALGRSAADMVIRGARVVNVFSEEVMEPTSVAVACGRVASLGPEEQGWLGADTELVQAEGLYLIPGLIDAHTHLDAVFRMNTYSEAALAHGNTAAISETSMIAGAWGINGVRAFMADAAACPMRLYVTAPSLTPPFEEFETSAGLSFEDFKTIMDDPLCLGIGETYWPAVTDHDPRVAKSFAYALSLGKTVEGHAAGARGTKLMAYAAAGATSCHEAIIVDEAKARLALGMAVQVREGFVRREMEVVVPGLMDLPDTRLVMLVTDMAEPSEMVDLGVMNLLVAKAVALGVEPGRAVAWCSLNPAKYFGLQRQGAVAPGYVADMALVEDLRDFGVAEVFLAGERVAAGGRLLSEPEPFAYPNAAFHTMTCAPPTADDFRVAAQGTSARVRVIEVYDGTITKESEAELAVDGGSVRPDVGQDVLKVAIVNRHEPGKIWSVGFTRGWGLKRGALAATQIWDTCNLLVIGASEEEMALAASRSIELGGGMVVVEGDRVVAELPMPIAGVISPEPLREINRQVAACAAAVGELGCTVERPFLTAQCFCFTGLPFLRLTDLGLMDVRRRKLVEVVLD